MMQQKPQFYLQGLRFPTEWATSNFAFQPPPEDPYNRAPLPARLKLFAADPITLASATKGAKAMCDQAGIKESDYTVTPLGNPGLSRLFAIDFVGLSTSFGQKT